MKLHRVLMFTAVVALPAAAAPPLTGTWSFDDDGTVVEFAPCGAHVCGTVRRLPARTSKPAEEPQCGQVLMGDLQAEGTAGAHRGWVLDPASRKRHAARIEPEGPKVKLIVRALGGLVSETFVLSPVAAALEACKP